MEIHETGFKITIPSFISIFLLLKVLISLCFLKKIQKVYHHFVTNLFSSRWKIPVFTVLSAFSKIGDALVKTFCILPHFYLFLYPGYSIRLPSRKSALPLLRNHLRHVFIQNSNHSSTVICSTSMSTKPLFSRLPFFTYSLASLSFSQALNN